MTRSFLMKAGLFFILGIAAIVAWHQRQHPFWLPVKSVLAERERRTVCWAEAPEDAATPIPEPALNPAPFGRPSTADTALIGPGAAGMTWAPKGAHFNGGGGFDTIFISGAGYAVLDGAQIVSLELVNLQNDLPNDLYVLEAYFFETETNAVMIWGDRDLDVVHLDGCLSWSLPELVWSAPDPDRRHQSLPDRWRLRGRSTPGSEVVVDISTGTRVEIIPPSRVAAWAEDVGPGVSRW
ncbi:MAG: hypothetical protein AAF415_09710 [Pseudomonadota bacterium]